MTTFVNITAEALPSMLLVAIWWGFLRSIRHSGYGIAFFSLFATTIHEACHWTCGLLLCARPTSMSLWPKRQGDSWVLGSVSFRTLTIWNAAPVAFAPLVMLPLGGLVFQYWMVPSFLDGAYLTWLLGGYVVACCFFACIPSSTDIRVGAASALMYSVIGYSLWRIASFVQS